MSTGLSATIGPSAGALSSASAPQNFTMSAGDQRILKVTVFDEAGEAIPLAGTTAVIWKLGRTARSVPALSKSLGEGITIATQQAAAGQSNCGRLDVLISAADSAELIGEYVHECRLIDAAGAPARIFYGRVFVSPSLT